MNSISVKRKRGRPRRDEPPEINEFDISLIRQFEHRPAFYDRSCVHYRNRDYLDIQWEEISKVLGYNVSLIKDRMIQLRNRYNLEKRRVESLQAQYDDPSIKSQWPLYDYMNFLGEYIKSRRPYRYSNTARSVLAGSIRKRSSSQSSSEGEHEESRNNTSNDTESESQHINANHINNPNFVENSTINHGHGEATTMNQQNLNSINMSTFLQGGGERSHQQQSTPLPSWSQPQLSHRKREKVRRQQLGAEKYKAFGQFLAASLIEMNELDALQLVNSFTADLVRAMHSGFYVKNSHNNSDNASDSLEISI